MSTTTEFEQLMLRIAVAWNVGNAAAAAECFAEDATYAEPPDRQTYLGRAQLYEFFGGASGPRPPMRMVWRHLAFNEGTQVGFGEYTFAMNQQYHGVAVVQVRDGKIARWREYQVPSELSWNEFTQNSPF